MAQSQYAQPTDLQLLSISAAAANRFGTAAMTAALQAASSLADSYLVGQFALPLQSSPQGWDMSLTVNVCNIAAKILFDQFGYNAGAPLDELIQRRWTEAIAWLVQIRDKQIQPQWVDSSSGNAGSDLAGDFIQSDPPVGFTPRGVGASGVGGLFVGDSDGDNDGD